MKSSIKLQNVFRRVSQGGSGSGSKPTDTVDGGEKKELGKLFGRSLEELCRVEGETVNLPNPIVVRTIFILGLTIVSI